MNKEKVSNYLKFGFTESLTYGRPYTIQNISWKDAIDGYMYYYEKAISKIDINNILCALSGGLDSSLNILKIKDKTPLIYSYVIEGNTDHIYAQKLAEYWGLKNFILVYSYGINLEESLISMNKIWDSPRCVTGDLHTYDAYFKAKLISDTLLAGVGSEPMSLGIGWMYSPIIELASVKQEYDCIKAKKIFDNSKYIDPLHYKQYDLMRVLGIRKKTYSEVIKNLFELGLFSDNQLKLLGLEPPEIKLREENVYHALQCTFDWYNPNMIGKRYPMLEKSLNLKTITPYADEELRKFCFSLPIEYRFCLGSERHVMRNFIGDQLPEFILNRNKEPFQPKIDWFFSNSSQIAKLIDKYILNPDRKIYSYIDYHQTIKLIETCTDYKRWALLNLSIWLEVHNE